MAWVSDMGGAVGICLHQLEAWSNCRITPWRGDGKAKITLKSKRSFFDHVLHCDPVTLQAWRTAENSIGKGGFEEKKGSHPPTRKTGQTTLLARRGEGEWEEARGRLLVPVGPEFASSSGASISATPFYLK